MTPRFPNGLSVLDVAGQYRDPTGRIGRERTKLLLIVVFNAPAHHAKVQAVDPTLERTISLIFVPGRKHSPAVAAFMRTIRAYRWD